MREGKQGWQGSIPNCPPSANELIRTHWAERKKLIDRWYLEVYAAFAHDLPTKATGKREVHVTVTSKRSRDHANLWLGVDKLIFDNLVKLGWLKDDDERGLSPKVIGKVGKPQTDIWIGG